ncbi:MAG: right-handed parallel beta-helix repeat-containing protein [Firmicutes bacterium]|nr:right-handed parallel beta-helix repeat-containing protein [Bacillota bacterium]
MSKKLRTLILLFLLITTAAFLTTGCGKKEKPKGYTISGVVTNSANNLGIKNVKLAVGEKVVTTDVHGKWSVSGLTGPVTVGVITDNLGWTFDRTSVEVSGAASDLDFTVTFDGIEETIKRVSLDGAATIVVPPGTYNLSGAINIVSRDIHLKSTDPDDPAVVAATIIKDHGIYIYRTPNRSIVEGLTISDEKSSGISVSDRGVATIRKNVIEGCGMHGISITSTIPDQIEIIDNIIRNNSVTETFG